MLLRARLHPTRIAERVLWGTAVVGAAAAGIASSAPTASPPGVAGPDRVGSAPDGSRDRPDAVVAAARVLADQDPFRVTHRPALVAFGTPVPVPGSGGSPPGILPAPPFAARPHLTLFGIVGGGGRWEAVLAGVAGREGATLVRTGDTLGGVRVGRVTADTVVVQGRDTVWHLTLETVPPGTAGGVGARP